jgi:hypothetical protein
MKGKRNMQFFLLLLLGVVASAETKPSIANIKTAAGEPRVWVALPSGRMAEAKLDGSIVLDTSGTTPVLRVTIPTVSIPTIVPAQKQTTTVTAVAQAVFQAAFAIDECFWNGLLMSEGDDYSLSVDRKTLTFLAGAPAVGDVVILKSQTTPRPAPLSSR